MNNDKDPLWVALQAKMQPLIDELNSQLGISESMLSGNGSVSAEIHSATDAMDARIDGCPCQNRQRTVIQMNEYIEKAELIKKLCFETAECYYSPTIKTIKEFPAADVQPVCYGRWENEHIEDGEAWWADCTNCKSETHSKFGRVSLYAFCPNCGARMDGEQNENN